MDLPLAIVLDGEASDRESTAEALRRAGVDAVVASTPQDALDIVRAWALAAAPPGHLRPEDVPALARSFVEGLRRLNHLPPIAIAPEALSALCRHEWNGDVGALRQAVETAVILATGGRVGLKDLPAFLRGGDAAEDPGGRHDRRFRTAKRSVVDAFERSYLSDLLRSHEGNVTAAAETAGMLRSALQRLLRKHDLRSSSFRPSAPAGPSAS
jgi:DNA-binding NtrC family response regulator